MQTAPASRAGMSHGRAATGSPAAGSPAVWCLPHAIEELTAAVQHFAEPCQFCRRPNEGQHQRRTRRRDSRPDDRGAGAEGRVGTAPRGARRAAAGDRPLSTLPRERPGRDSLPSPADPQPSGASQRVVRVAGGLSCALRRAGAGTPVAAAALPAGLHALKFEDEQVALLVEYLALKADGFAGCDIDGRRRVLRRLRAHVAIAQRHRGRLSARRRIAGDHPARRRPVASGSALRRQRRTRDHLRDQLRATNWMPSRPRSPLTVRSDGTTTERSTSPPTAASRSACGCGSAHRWCTRPTRSTPPTTSSG